MQRKKQEEGKEGGKNKTKDGLFKQNKTKKNKPFDFLTLKYHTLGNKYIVSIKKNCHFPCCVCLLDALMAAVGQRRAQIRTSTRQNGRCAPSEPRLHTRSMQVHKETRSTHGRGRWYYRIRVLALCSCAGPWTSCQWVNDRTVHLLSWGPSSLLYVWGSLTELSLQFCNLEPPSLPPSPPPVAV